MSSLCLLRIDRTSDHCQGVTSLCVERIDRTSDHCQRIAVSTTDTPRPCSFKASTPHLFLTQTLRKSFKIHCVVPIPKRASLRNFFKPASFCVFVASATRRREFATWQNDVCKRLGLPWPPKAKAGKPSRQVLWLRAIYVEGRVGRTLPDAVTPSCALLHGFQATHWRQQAYLMLRLSLQANWQSVRPLTRSGQEAQDNNGRS